MAQVQGELAAQTKAFKEAHAAALSGGDVDSLFEEVIEKNGDASHLGQVASTYEALYTQFGQLVLARFLASNSAGIPTHTGSEARASDAATVAEAARSRAAAYEANITHAAGELKQLLALDQTPR
jgi:hypothetical protein